jgi:hypothetical protein
MGFAAAVHALPSYFGLNGLHFIPSGRTSEAGEHGFAVSSLPATASELDVFPYSVRGYLTIRRGIEVGLTNTYVYYLQHEEDYFGLPMEGGGFVAADANAYAPVIPSVKFAFLDEAVPNGSLAVGAEFPYGVFTCFDYLVTLEAGISLYFVVGLATTVSTLHGFGGVGINLPLGFSVALEGAYAGQTKVLTTPQETFISVGVTYALTGQVGLNYVFRLDRDGVRRMAFGFDVKF